MNIEGSGNIMSLGNLMSGALDVNTILQGLAANGGNVIIINAGSSEAEGPEEDAGEMSEEGETAAPPLPVPPPIAAKGPMPPIGPDMENAAEGGVEEPTDLMSAAKAALLKK